MTVLDPKIPLELLWLALLAGGGSYLVGFLVHRLLVWGNIMDRPNERSSHREPIARGGGVAMVGVFALYVVLRVPSAPVACWLAAALAIATVSFVDDLRSLSSLLRLACHAAAASVALIVLGGVSAGSGTSEPIPLLWALGVAVLTVVGLTGYTNAFNFMDGINGLVAGQAVITGCGMALVVAFGTSRWTAEPVQHAVVLAAITAGFIPHNFPRPRMFMGDVGSATLGFLLASLLVWLVRDFGTELLLPLTLLHANFILDTGVTLFRRLARGDRWHEAHREHFYQRLVRAGMSHASVTLIQMGLQLVVVVLALLHVRHGRPGAVGLTVLIVGIWLCYFLWAERRFRRLTVSAAPRL